MGKAQVVDYQVFSLNGENYSLCIIFLSFLKILLFYRERRLEERERRHEMEDREYRRMGYESYPTDYYGDDRYYGDGPQMRRGRGRGRGRSY